MFARWSQIPDDLLSEQGGIIHSGNHDGDAQGNLRNSNLEVVEPLC